jgi:hypothetical protein
MERNRGNRRNKNKQRSTKKIGSNHFDIHPQHIQKLNGLVGEHKRRRKALLNCWKMKGKVSKKSSAEGSRAKDWRCGLFHKSLRGPKLEIVFFEIASTHGMEEE